MPSLNLLQLLVPAKVTPPQPGATYVRRERLLARLDAVVPTRLTLIIAPAGFGKSTLAAQWLLRAQPAQCDAAAVGEQQPVAWLTLDEHDQDSLRFLAYVAGAITRVIPQALTTTAPLLSTREPPPPYVVLQALLVDLSALPGGLTLVLDDYHTITAEPVNQALAYLLRHWPATCRLVILSRVTPRLPLARLRADRQLTELRAADLRFSENEATALLANLSGRMPDTAQVASLQAETDGWALALQLAALAHIDGASLEHAKGMATRQIAEFLADEVFDQQSAAIQAALLALAIPERICAELAADLLDPPGDLLRAEAVLDRLVQANLFLLPLDAEGRWFGFHHLFRELLLRRLHLTQQPDRVCALQLRAAHWLAGANLVEEALRHFMLAGAEEAAAELIERSMHMNLGREVRTTPPGYWLGMLPDRLIAARPGLALIEARLASFHTDVPALAASLERVEALLAAPRTAEHPLPWPTFMGDCATLRGSLRYWQGRPAEAIQDLQTALELGPVPTLASQALHILGKAYVAAGRYSEGVQSIQTASTRAADVLGSLATVTRYLALCGMHATAGTAGDLACDARHLAEEVAQRGLSDFWICYAAAYRGRAAYECSDLAVAAEQFAAVVRRRYQINAPIYIGCLAGLAEIALSHGDFDTAADYVQQMRAFGSEVGGVFLRHQALGCAVRLAIARGDLPEAVRTADEIDCDMHQGINTWFAVETPRLSKARALILAGEPAQLAQAETLVIDLLAEVEPLHNIRLQIGAYATHALLRQAQGRPAEALASLERAVNLAAPRGYLRSFVDLGPALKPLLCALAERGVARDYLAGVLAAYALRPEKEDAPALPLPGQTIPELLTPREMEILALLAERWSDKEIATRLVITQNTVRRHSHNLYGKLGVNSRRKAVEVARALGILPAA